MKKKLAALLIACAVIATPVSVYADEKDDRIAELEAQVAELETQVADLQKLLDEAQITSSDQDCYKLGETWTVEGQWKITVNSVEEIPERNEYFEKNPAAVYRISYSYENLGYNADGLDGLFIDFSDGIVDSAGKMGYSYPGDLVMYPQETPVGATCEAQACIGVDNPGNFKINYSFYDGNGQSQTTVFDIEVE